MLYSSKAIIERELLSRLNHCHINKVSINHGYPPFHKSIFLIYGTSEEKASVSFQFSFDTFIESKMVQKKIQTDKDQQQMLS